jgi:tetratricopeptide (TPR) repeat protein
MISTHLVSSEAFRRYVALLRRLHRLFFDGKEDSQEADGIRDAMDGPWDELTAEQREIVSGLAADLNSIRRGAPASEIPREGAPAENERALSRSYQAGNWDDVLKYLRRLAPFRQPAHVEYLRGRAWSNLLDDDTALLFFEHSRCIDPDNKTIAYAALQCLAKVDLPAAEQRADGILADPEHHSEEVVIAAAGIRCRSLPSVPDGGAGTTLQDLIRVLDRTLERLQVPRAETQHPALFAAAVSLASGCYQLLGDLESARRLFDEAVKRRPRDAGLRVGRGMLLYRRDEGEAVRDFELAAKLEVPVVWPYFFLAHHRLVQNRFADCLEFCGLTLQLPAPATIRANVLEWVAICQWHLGFPPQVVRASFDAARELAPDNERTAKNARLFENLDADRREGEPAWAHTLPAEMPTFGQAETESLLTAVG